MTGTLTRRNGPHQANDNPQPPLTRRRTAHIVAAETYMGDARVCLVQDEWRRVCSSYRQRVPAGGPWDHKFKAPLINLI